MLIQGVDEVIQAMTVLPEAQPTFHQARSRAKLLANSLSIEARGEFAAILADVDVLALNMQSLAGDMKDVSYNVTRSFAETGMLCANEESVC